MMAAHQGLLSGCALQCDSQAEYKAIWQTVSCYNHAIYMDSCQLYQLPIGHQAALQRVGVRQFS